MKAQKSGGGAQVFGFLDNKSSINNGSGGTNEVDNGFNEFQLAMVDDTENLVNQRDEEITRIAKSIEELAQIFNELAVLVIDQGTRMHSLTHARTYLLCELGTILDRIDYNMETAVEHAKEGVVQLEKAEENQKNALPVSAYLLTYLLTHSLPHLLTYLLTHLFSCDVSSFWWFSSLSCW